jgi:hypothetical protein
VLWLGALALKWITCPSGWDHEIRSNLILRNRDLWRNAHLCDWCAPYWRLETYCNTVMWVVVVGFFVAAGYWVLAHLDDVMRGAERLMQKSRADRHAPPSIKTPDTQHPAETSSRSSLPREVFVEFVAEALWDLISRRRNRS